MSATRQAEVWRALGAGIGVALGRARAGLGARALAANLAAERARWLVWLPVLLGAGIVFYFHLPFEPHAAVALAAPLGALALRAAAGPGLLREALVTALLVVCVGFAIAKSRTEWVRAPVLAYTLRAADVTGYVALVEPRDRGQRITLWVSRIAGVAEAETPRLVRIRAMRSLSGLKAGDGIRLRATLSPPAGPALPGGFDFARAAWYSGIGATGYALSPPAFATQPAAAPLRLQMNSAIERVRQAIGARIESALPGETGAIANALITGERGGISEATTEAFRDSGLIHILSISGLHMVIMAGSVFAALRLLGAAIPSVALRYPIKKWAAGAAALAAFGYLLISGSSVATVRACIMLSIMLFAVMLDRPALAMRNVAIAALAILCLMPESVLDAGFQMSFAAVVALIAAYEALRDRPEDGPRAGALRRAAFFLGGIVASTLLAGLAVAPFAAYHFHRSQHLGFLANLIAVPICNLVVMPAGLITLVLMPFGLERVPLLAMEVGIEIMAATARWVAALPGAVVSIPAFSDLAFGFMVGGGLWLALWRLAWRWLGPAAIAAGLALTPGGARLDVLVGREGELVALRAGDGRRLRAVAHPTSSSAGWSTTGTGASRRLCCGRGPSAATPRPARRARREGSLPRSAIPRRSPRTAGGRRSSSARWRLRRTARVRRW